MTGWGQRKQTTLRLSYPADMFPAQGWALMGCECRSRKVDGEVRPRPVLATHTPHTYVANARVNNGEHQSYLVRPAGRKEWIVASVDCYRTQKANGSHWSVCFFVL